MLNDGHGVFVVDGLYGVGNGPWSIAMGDLQKGNARFIETRSDIGHLLQGYLVTHRVHAIAQAHVMQLDLAISYLLLKGHHAFSLTGSSFIRPAIIS